MLSDAGGSGEQVARLKKHLRSKWFWCSVAVILAFFIVMISLKVDLQVIPFDDTLVVVY
jgi:bacteriorhodopsin